jgi:hypothetical protein
VWRYLRLFSHRRLPLQTLRTLYTSHRLEQAIKGKVTTLTLKG